MCGDAGQEYQDDDATASRALAEEGVDDLNVFHDPFCCAYPQPELP